MDLSEIRQHVVELSGRFDLVDPAQAPYTPSGNIPLSIDTFINWGQKILDDMVTVPGAEYTHAATLSAGDYSVLVSGLRVIKDIYASNSDGVKSLIRELPVEMRERYGMPPFSGVAQGRPVYYMLDSIRDSDPAVANAGNLERHIYSVPPADGTYTLSVRGLFYSPTLTNATDVTWWSRIYPFTLVQAALYTMERFYRNTQGANDHLIAIQRDLQGIDFNIAEEASGKTTRMKNAW